MSNLGAGADSAGGGGGGAAQMVSQGGGPLLLGQAGLGAGGSRVAPANPVSAPDDCS